MPYCGSGADREDGKQIFGPWEGTTENRTASKVALGADREGGKQILALWQGATKNGTVYNEYPSGLIRRAWIRKRSISSSSMDEGPIECHRQEPVLSC